MTRKLVPEMRKSRDIQEGFVGFSKRLRKDQRLEMGEIPPLMRERYFRYNDWAPLSVDAGILNELSNIGFAGEDVLWLQVATAYVLCNRDEVNRYEKIESQVYELLMHGKGCEEVIDAERRGGPLKSLYMIKLACASYRDYERVQKVVRVGKSYPWFSEVCAKTGHYYLGSDNSNIEVDEVVRHYVPACEHTELFAQLLTILFSENCNPDTGLLSLRICTLLHPYDALNLVYYYIEQMFLHSDGIMPAVRECLSRFAEAGINGRFVSMYSAYGIKGERDDELSKLVSFDSHREFWQSIMHHRPAQNSCGSLLINEIVKIYEVRYPEPKNAYTVMHSAKIYAFTRFGDLINGVIASLYLHNRKAFELEAYPLLRFLSLIDFAPIMVQLAPSGLKIARQAGIGILDADSLSQAVNKLEARSQTRSGFVATAWSTDFESERNSFGAWLVAVRAKLRHVPGYYVGCRWDVLHEEIRVARISTLRSNPDFLYALALHTVEQSPHKTTKLKVALELIAGRFESASSFLLHLVELHDSKSIPIWTRLLTPNMLMQLGLAQDSATGMDSRYNALHEMTTRYGYSSLWTKDEMTAEEDKFRDQVMIAESNGSRFSIPYSVLIGETIPALDATDLNWLEESDQFDSAVTRYLPAHDANSYRALDSDIRKVVFKIYQALVTLNTHSIYGVEVILSTRIRHLHLLNHLKAAFDASLVDRNPDYTIFMSNNFFGPMRIQIERAIEEWITTRLHSNTVDKPSGMFDSYMRFDEMVEIATKKDLTTNEHIAAFVTGISSTKLSEGLAKTNELLETELKAGIHTIINTHRDLMIKNSTFADQLLRGHSVLVSHMTHSFTTLHRWFQTATYTSGDPATWAQILKATRYRFDGKIRTRQLEIIAAASSISDPLFPNHMIIPALLVAWEAIFNSLKWAPPGSQTVRFSVRSTIIGTRIYVSSKTRAGARNMHVSSDTTTDINEKLLKENNTGMSKIAALSAYIQGKNSTVKGRVYRGFYVLSVPI